MPQRNLKVNNLIIYIYIYEYHHFVEEQIIAKSSILLDVKPWDDETDLNAMEKAIRSVEADGLVWGQGKE
jgi:hypothetical protein